MKKINWDKLLIAVGMAAIVVAVTADVMKPTAVEQFKSYYQDEFYTVRKGDTVWSICAERTPDDLDVRDMQRWVIQRNNIFDAANIPEGRVLIIPVMNRNK